MYTVFRYFNDDGEVSYDLIGVFPSEELAQHYCLFYAVAHQITVDDLIIGYDEHRNLNDIVYGVN